MANVRCPKCGSLAKESDGFCRECGARLSERSATGPFGQPVEESQKVPSGLLLWLLEIFPGLIRVEVIVGFLVATGFSLAGIWLSVFLLQMGGMIATFAVGGAAVVVYWAGLCWLLAGYFCTPVEAMVEFTEKQWLALVMLTMIPGSAFLLLMKLASEQA